MPRDLTRSWAQAEDVRPPPRGAATPHHRALHALLFAAGRLPECGCVREMK